jgi:hypothetical protein
MSLKASNAKVVRLLPNMYKPNLELRNYELAIGTNELKLEEFHLKDMVLELASYKSHFNTRDGKFF